MESDNCDLNITSEEFSINLQIPIDCTDTGQLTRIFNTALDLREQENLDNGCGEGTVHITCNENYGDGKNPCDNKLTRMNNSDKEADTESTSDFDLLIGDQYWEQLEYTSKLNNPRRKHSKSLQTEKKYLTYRKVDSKEKAERKLPPSYYKLDKPTILTIEKLLDVRSLEQYQNVIGIGRTSVIISAGFTNQSFVNAVKVYKLSNDDNLNKAIYKRTAKEFEYMKHLAHLVPIIPFPVSCHKNILVMSMVGTSEEPALPLTSLTPEYYDKAYHIIVSNIKTFFRYHTVHGKLCAENILVWHNDLYHVGWSHSVTKSEPSALKKLMRDCCFVTKFFKTRNVAVMPTETLFKYVSMSKEISPDVLAVKQNKEARKVKCSGNLNRGPPSYTPSSNCRFKC